MTIKAQQQHIDAAGRLAGLIHDLSDDTITQLDVLEWCAQANIVLANDTKTPATALADTLAWVQP